MRIRRIGGDRGRLPAQPVAVVEASAPVVGRVLKVVGLVVLALGALAALGTFVVRDQVERHRRDLFSDRPLRRLAALGYLSGRPADIDTIRLLNDYIAWEPQPLIRRRAAGLLARLEQRLADDARAAGEVAG